MSFIAFHIALIILTVLCMAFSVYLSFQLEETRRVVAILVEIVGNQEHVDKFQEFWRRANNE